MNVYQVPPGGLSTWRAAQRLMGGMGAHPGRVRRRMRGSPRTLPMRGYSRANPIYRMRGLRWLGDDSTPPDVGLPTFVTNAPVAPFGLDAVPLPPVTQVPYTDINETGTLLPAQQAAASAPYTNVMSQIANALSNPGGVAAAQPRTILTPAPATSVSSLLSSLPSWALPAALVVGGLALIGGTKKGRR